MSDEPANLPAVPGDVEPRLDIHYEADLDEAPPAAGPPVYVDLTRSAGERLPVIPESLRGLGNIRASVVRAGGRHWHSARYHGVRSPLYLVLAVAWAVVGLLRITGQMLRWWHVNEQFSLRSQAAAASDAAEWLKLHREAKETRRVRGIILAGLATGLVVGVVALLRFGQWWPWMLLVCVGLPVLARHGRPAGKPIVGQAVVTPRFRVEQ